jgi:hypothetical protein
LPNHLLRENPSGRIFQMTAQLPKLGKNISRNRSRGVT